MFFSRLLLSSLCMISPLLLMGLDSPQLSDSDQILCTDLHGLVLVDTVSKLKKSHGPIEGVHFDGIEAPGGNESLGQELTPLFYRHPLTSATINGLKRKIAAYYREHDYPLVRVIVPEQHLAANVLHLVVVEAKLGKIHVNGNHHTTELSIEKWIRSHPGEAINESLLLKDISWINTNPFRQVNLVYRPGEKTGTTDIDLMVSDRKRWRSYVGGDNTGSALIGRTRWFTGLNLSNIFWSDHMLTFQFTTCNDFRKFKSYVFQYAAPLPWRNTFSFFGAYATVHPHQPTLRSDGKTYQVTGRYTIPQWFDKTFWADQFSYEIGFDFKGTNNNIFFGGDNITPVQQQLAWIGQFAGSFYVNRDRKEHKIAAGIELYWSPSQMLPHQTPEDFATLRANATAHYFYTRFALSWMQNLPRQWSLNFQARAQFADSNLLASEQFALGGYSTVRGYNERVVNGDNAVCGNLEFRSPNTPIIGRWKRKIRDTFQGLAFIDFGYGWDHEKISGFPIAQTLLGIGPGIRYRIESYLSIRCDLGFPLHHVTSDNGEPRVHLNALLSY